MRLLLDAMRQCEDEQLRNDHSTMPVVGVVDSLVLSTCPDYLDALETLTGLERGPLTLATQATCRRLRVLADRLAVDVARELYGS